MPHELPLLAPADGREKRFATWSAQFRRHLLAPADGREKPFAEEIDGLSAHLLAPADGREKLCDANRNTPGRFLARARGRAREAGRCVLAFEV